MICNLLFEFYFGFDSNHSLVPAPVSLARFSRSIRRARSRGKVDGRSQEIQRLVGRSLRAAVHMDKLGERSFTLDCDVLDADGGTRTASITGGELDMSSTYTAPA